MRRWDTPGEMPPRIGERVAASSLGIGAPEKHALGFGVVKEVADMQRGALVAERIGLERGDEFVDLRVFEADVLINTPPEGILHGRESWNQGHQHSVDRIHTNIRISFVSKLFRFNK